MDNQFKIIEKYGLGIILALIANIMLSIMSGSIKYLTEQGYSTFQIMFFNGIIGASIILILFFIKKDLSKLKVMNPFLIIYMLVALSAGFALFYAFGHGNLAEMSSILASAPFMITIFSFVFLSERLKKRQIALILIGFLGVLFVFKPSLDFHDNLIPSIALLGTFLFSLNIILVKKLTGVVDTFIIPLYYFVGLIIVMGLMMSYKEINPDHIKFFVLSGACDVTSLILLYTAIKHAPASFIAPFQYSQILWSGIIGYIFWADMPDKLSLLGIMIIIISGVAFTVSSIKNKKRV